MAESYLKSDGLNLVWKTQLNANDSARQETLGAIRVLEDGRKFRYVQMTGQALSEGQLVKPAAVTTISNLTSNAAKTVITDSDATWTINQYVGYYFKLTTGGTGSVEARKVVANTATTLTLEKALGTALAAGGTDDGEIQPPLGVVIISAITDQSQPVCGVGIGTITQNYFGWVQIAGYANVLGTTLTETQPVCPGGATAGYALDGSAATDHVIGTCIAAAGTGEQHLIYLRIPE